VLSQAIDNIDSNNSILFKFYHRSHVPNFVKISSERLVTVSTDKRTRQ